MNHDDPQIDAVYRWDESLDRYDEVLNFAGFESFLRDLDREWGLNQPKIVLAPARSRTCFEAGFDQISVAEDQITKISALHETAHHIAAEYELDQLDKESHGPVFVRLALDLYSTYLPVDKNTLFQNLRARGIKVAPPNCFMPPDPSVAREFSDTWAAWNSCQRYDRARLEELQQRIAAHQEFCRAKLRSLPRPWW